PEVAVRAEDVIASRLLRAQEPHLDSRLRRRPAPRRLRHLARAAGQGVIDDQQRLHGEDAPGGREGGRSGDRAAALTAFRYRDPAILRSPALPISRSPGYSGLMPAAFATFAHFTSSSRT